MELAGELLAERGYMQTSIRDIARHASVTSGAIYGHFRNKAELLAEVINTRTAVELEAETMGRGEVDYVETTCAATDVDFFLHYGSTNKQTSAARTLDVTQWHDYAAEWTSTGVRGYVDGVLWFTDTTAAHLPPRSMHQTMQLDWFPSGSTPTTPSSMKVAWTRYYAV